MPELSQEKIDELTQAAAAGTQAAAELITAQAATTAANKKADEALTAVGEMKATADKTEQDRLKGQNEFKTLYEQEQAAHIKTVEGSDALKNSVFETFKQNEIVAEAKKIGLRDEAVNDLKLYPSESVIALSEAGTVRVTGAAEHAANLKKLRPFLFKDKTDPDLNLGKPGNPIKPGSTGTPTDAELIELKKKDEPAYFAKMKELQEAKQKELAGRK